MVPFLSACPHFSASLLHPHQSAVLPVCLLSKCRTASAGLSNLVCLCLSLSACRYLGIVPPVWLCGSVASLSADMSFVSLCLPDNMPVCLPIGITVRLLGYSFPFAGLHPCLSAWLFLSVCLSASVSVYRLHPCLFAILHACLPAGLSPLFVCLSLPSLSDSQHPSSLGLSTCLHSCPSVGMYNCLSACLYPCRLSVCRSQSSSISR